jgi:hypothetical protein
MAEDEKAKSKLWAWLGWSWLVMGGIVAVRWYLSTPTVGYGGLALAMGATLMPLIWEKVGVVCKMGWLAMLFCLLFVEYRAIDKDHKESADALAKSFGDISQQANANLKQVLDDEHKSFADLLKTEDQRFEKTMEAILASQRKSEREFAALLKEQESLFKHEDDLAAALNGSLVPANDPMPSTGCGQPDDGIVMMLGTEEQHNGVVVRKFPQLVMTGKYGPILSLDRASNGAVNVLLDIKSSDGKIIARLDRDGFVVNRNNYLEMKHDKSTLNILDEYGEEVLYVRYNNARAITVRGVLSFGDKKTRIGLPHNFGYICASGGSATIFVGP